MILGAAMLAWPGKTMVLAVLVFGAYLVVSALFQFALALSLRVPVSMRLLPFVSGIAALVLAVLCFTRLQDSMLLLAIWIGIGFVFRGVASVVAAVGDPRLPGRQREILVGVVSLLAGLATLAAPLHSLTTLIWVMGIWLVVIGAFDIVAAFGIRGGSQPASPVDPPDPLEPDVPLQPIAQPAIPSGSGSAASTEVDEPES